MVIEEASEQIVSACRKMWQQGWVASNDGNVSARLDDGSFLTTPTGVSKGEITRDMLLRVDLAGNLLEGKDGYRPTSEFKMHARCYEKRPDIAAVVHSHAPCSTAFAVAHKSMDMYNMIGAVCSMGAVPLTPFGTPSTAEVPDAIEPFLEEHDALLLESHGVLTLGGDVMRAYYRMESLELWAKTTINAVILGGSRDISRGNIEKLLNLRSFYGITGRHPGYVKYDNGLKSE